MKQLSSINDLYTGLYNTGQLATRKGALVLKTRLITYGGYDLRAHRVFYRLVDREQSGSTEVLKIGVLIGTAITEALQLRLFAR